MAEIETKRHEPIIYKIHDLICSHPGKWYSTEDLCRLIYGDYSPSLDTAMREIIREISLDEILQTIIISGKQGFKAAQNDDEVEQYLNTALTTACSHFDRYWTIRRKYGRDLQMKLPIGKYDSLTYEAVKRVERDNAIEINIQQTESGQLSFGV
jgi:hypothetical protein